MLLNRQSKTKEADEELELKQIWEKEGEEGQKWKKEGGGEGQMWEKEGGTGDGQTKSSPQNGIAASRQSGGCWVSSHISSPHQLVSGVLYLPNTHLPQLVKPQTL